MCLQGECVGVECDQWLFVPDPKGWQRSKLDMAAPAMLSVISLGAADLRGGIWSGLCQTSVPVAARGQHRGETEIFLGLYIKLMNYFLYSLCLLSHYPLNNLQFSWFRFWERNRVNESSENYLLDKFHTVFWLPTCPWTLRERLVADARSLLAAGWNERT